MAKIAFLGMGAMGSQLMLSILEELAKLSPQ